MNTGVGRLRTGTAALVGITAMLVAAPAAAGAVTATATTSAIAVPAKAQSPDPKLTVAGVTLGRTTVAVSGLNRVAVPVTVKAGYNSDDPLDDGTVLNVFLRRTGGTGAVRTMIAGHLKLTAGTLKNGTWTGTVEVPSTANGTFKVYGVRPGTILDGSDGSMTTETPFDGPSIAVTGLHVPKLGVSVIPRVVPFGQAFQVKAAIYDSVTRKPYGSRILLQVVNDNLCVEYDAGSKYTDRAGILLTSFPAAAADSLVCVRVRGKFFDTLGTGFFVLRPGIVGATPSKTSAKVGTIVPVNGTVAGAPSNCPIFLQRLRGASQWRGVSQDVVRQSGRFTLLAQPPYAGNIIYRAYFPTCSRFQAGVSKSFVIKGI
ncbi:hypothetical protein [Kribbella sp. CA-293567]|uniref:hypothetical protein n=1 Tax=Kribbella sp. CA-293567 TaxID=3002436 RepID=UPI0022DD20C8|nr:hypothetical protein [Kribbella sp. CA-293567]WBQ05400.1 hypothetical protein OX958_01050 [Kribbella sp. CA-293567]